MQMPRFETLQYQQQEMIAVITISRPKALNALNVQVLEEMLQLFHVLGQQPPRCVVITGEGERAFVAGADIAAMSEMQREQAIAFASLGHQVMQVIEHFVSPVIAAVNGFALGGGCELLLSCDLVYAASTAKFGQPEVKLGLIPGFGGTVRLPRKMGPTRAAEWIYTGNVYTAQEAQEAGLVNRVVEPGALMSEVMCVAQTIAQRGPQAVAMAKQTMLRGLSCFEPTALALEQMSFTHLFAQPEMREGTSAFLQKRDPQF